MTNDTGLARAPEKKPGFLEKTWFQEFVEKDANDEG